MDTARNADLKLKQKRMKQGYHDDILQTSRRSFVICFSMESKIVFLDMMHVPLVVYLKA